jgi:hypothetical protein
MRWRASRTFYAQDDVGIVDRQRDAAARFGESDTNVFGAGGIELERPQVRESARHVTWPTDLQLVPNDRDFEPIGRGPTECIHAGEFRIFLAGDRLGW